MPIVVTLLTPDARPFGGVPREIAVEAATVGEAIDAWLAALPGVERERIRRWLDQTDRRSGLVIVHNTMLLRRPNRLRIRRRAVKSGDVLRWFVHF